MKLPKQAALRNGILAVSSYVATFVICMLLLPKGVLTNDGMSYYGVYKQTVLPYTIGLILVVWFLIQVSRNLPAKLPQAFRYSLELIAVMVTILILTPYNHSPSFHRIHVLTGTWLFFFQYFLMIWFVFVRPQKQNAIMMLSAITIVFLFTGFYLNAIDGYLIIGQIVFQLIYSYSAYQYIRSAYDK